jgi:hypothetical protein
MMELGLMAYVRQLAWFGARREDNIVRTRELYRLFVRQYDLHVDLDVVAHPRGWSIGYIPHSISDRVATNQTNGKPALQVGWLLR